MLLETLKSFEKPEVDYIDVGANHPTSISNTYLLYRHGASGYLVEPNRELCNLCRRFRPRDRVLNIGIGASCGIMPFYVSRTPVGSTFDREHMSVREQTVDRVDYVPVLPLDIAFGSLGIESVGVLSIDVEGWNLSAIESARELLKSVFVLCIEYDTPNERTEILREAGSFELVADNGCNLIMKARRS